MKFRIRGIRVTSVLGCTVSVVGIRHGFYQLQLLVGAWPKAPLIVAICPPVETTQFDREGLWRLAGTSGFTLAGLRVVFCHFCASNRRPNTNNSLFVFNFSLHF
jgi:hypothetical protein